MKKSNLLIGGVLILILFFGIKFFTHKPKTAPVTSSDQAPVQLKEEPVGEGLTSDNKQTTESPEEPEPEYEFPSKRDEILVY